jgi:hypothetical protein
MREAHRIAADLPAETLDLLLFTAGVMAGSASEITDEGIEIDMAASYLSRVANARSARASANRAGGKGTVGDLNADRSYDARGLQLNPVAGNEILVLNGARRYPNANLYGLNPGLVATNICANTRRNPALRRMLGVAATLMAIKPAILAERLTPLVGVARPGRP